MTTNLPALLFLIPFFAAVLIPVLGPFRRSAVWPAAGLALGGLTLTALRAFWVVKEGGPVSYPLSGWRPPIGIELYFDGLAGLMVLLLSSLSLIGVLYLGPAVNRRLGHRVVPFYTLVLLLIASLIGIVMSGDLFNLFVFLEVASLCAYALVAVGGGRALLSAFRYLILGTISASFYLLGVGYLYAATGTLNMADLASLLPGLLESKAVISGFVFILIGLGIKAALVPLHGWLPDAYAHAPEGVSPLLASLMTKVALYALARVSLWILGPDVVWSEIPVLTFMGWVAAFATLVGGFLALSEVNLKRMFAYGGLSHIGLVVVALSLGSPSGYAAGIYYLLTDAVMQAGLFFVAGTLITAHGAREISDLTRVGRGMPWTITALIVSALSMVGIPPTGGFFGKWLIIMGALEAENYTAVAVTILVTLLTLVYFGRILEKLLFGRLGKAVEEAVEKEEGRAFEGPAARLALGTVTASLVLLGLFSGPVVTFIRDFAVPAF